MREDETLSLPGRQRRPGASGTLLAGLRKNRYLYLMLVPFVAFFVVFKYFPMVALQVAFRDYNIVQGVWRSQWIGLENFRLFFAGPYFLRCLRNTLLLSLYNTLFFFPLPIVLALLLNEMRSAAFRKATVTLLCVPHFISLVIITGLVTNFLAPSNGLLNLVIEKLGGEKVYFLTKRQYFRPIFIGIQIYKDAGFSSVLFLAALANIDLQLYEAATIDGAGRVRQMWYVTLPGILPTVVITLLVRLGSFLEVSHEMIILLYQPVTYEVADVISTYVYRAGLLGGQISLASAAGLFTSVAGLVLVVCANRVSRWLTDSSLW